MLFIVLCLSDRYFLYTRTLSLSLYAYTSHLHAYTINAHTAQIGLTSIALVKQRERGASSEEDVGYEE